MVQPKKIILINGSGGVGKDTFVECCEHYVHVKNVSSVDIIKEVAKKLGWNGIEKSGKTRKFLSDLKLLSTEYSNHPFEYMSGEVAKFMQYRYATDNAIKGIICLHIREPEELKKMKDSYPDCIALLVTNPRIEQITSNMADANVQSFKYDYTVVNDGTILDLKSKALWFLVDVFNGGHKQ